MLGPTIARKSYETGPEFYERFVARDASYAKFFEPSGKAGHNRFDLPAFIAIGCERPAPAASSRSTLDTYADEARFYSFRRKTHRGEEDYGRLISAIVL